MIHLSYRNFSKSLVDDNVENLQDIEYAAMLKSIFSQTLKMHGSKVTGL